MVSSAEILPNGCFFFLLSYHCQLALLIDFLVLVVYKTRKNKTTKTNFKAYIHILNIIALKNYPHEQQFNTPKSDADFILVFGFGLMGILLHHISVLCVIFNSLFYLFAIWCCCCSFKFPFKTDRHVVNFPLRLCALYRKTCKFIIINLPFSYCSLPVWRQLFDTNVFIALYWRITIGNCGESV